MNEETQELTTGTEGQVLTGDKITGEVGWGDTPTIQAINQSAQVWPVDDFRNREKAIEYTIQIFGDQEEVPFEEFAYLLEYIYHFLRTGNIPNAVPTAESLDIF